ncbi:MULTISPECIES: DUF2064 domain-containing protein [Flavobacteriaceae]|uniref:TIGR04282 family arsenosugar biosynthesis glycosyltransferase n=1 Tax=Flavobacteriaceae TaxID=49546 RepID=UPI001492C0F8|nr:MULTISPECIES: DUF2064 domain-containing protein [Allomuricauda]MDC6366472.1 DUF2064 domain-containing protein [Muricauda sp. AC10]
MIALHKKLIQNTAVLIFANSAAKDALAKKNCANPSLFDQLTHHTLDMVKATGLPYFHFSEKEQRGETFAKRLSHAIQSVFQLGYSQVISIGNDTPNLRKSHILDAHRRLTPQNVVLGPSLDGGFYLLGMHRSHFDAEAFEALPWQQAALYQKTTSYFKTKGAAVHALDKLIDIDSVADLKLLCNHIKTLSKKWIGFFSSLLDQNSSFISPPLEALPKIPLRVPSNKGSPFSFA